MMKEQAADDNGAASSDNGSGGANNKMKKILGGVCCVIVLGLVIAVIVWFATRPEDIDVVESNQVESLPSVVKVATLPSTSSDDNNGAIAIESTTLLSDSSVKKYYINVFEVDYTELVENESDIQLLDLVVSQLQDPTFDMLGSSPIRIVNVTQQQFPYLLPDLFDPQDYNSIIFLLQNGMQLPSGNVAAFGNIISNNGGNGGDDNDETDGDGDGGSDGPTTLPVLTTQLESSSYNIGGKITIDYRTELVNGVPELRPFLRFEIPSAPTAPGPYLWLSKRSYSETRRSRLQNDDIEILIDHAPGGGAFSVQGTFEQPLDEIIDVNDVADYANGSWIVWCRPFRVWLGGGQINIVQ